MAQTHGDATSPAPDFRATRRSTRTARPSPACTASVGEPGHAGDAAQARQSAHRTEGRADRGRRRSTARCADGAADRVERPPDARRRALPPRLQVAAWAGIPGARARVLRARAAESATASSASLNVSDRVGDDPHCGRDQLGAGSAARWPGLSHRPHAAGARRRGSRGSPRGDRRLGEADGMITAPPGVGLAVLTADCVPMLCVAPAARRGDGAACRVARDARRHRRAGCTRGADAARRRAAPSGDVALGPSIGGCCYEVEIAHRRSSSSTAGVPCLMPGSRRATHGQLDLRAANRADPDRNGRAASADRRRSGRAPPAQRRVTSPTAARGARRPPAQRDRLGRPTAESAT